MAYSELKFDDIKDELTAMVDDIMRQFLYNQIYDQTQVQSWCEGISDEIIKALHQQQRGFKFSCTCTIFPKGETIGFSLTNLFNPNQDGVIKVKYEDDRMYAFVYLFGFAP